MIQGRPSGATAMLTSSARAAFATTIALPAPCRQSSPSRAVIAIRWSIPTELFRSLVAEPGTY
jgi:hypothetical protein